MAKKRKKLKKSVRIILLVWALLLAGAFGYLGYRKFFSGSEQNAADNDTAEETAVPEEEKEVVTEASLFMVGDALLHITVYEDGRTADGFDFTPMLDRIGEIARQYDLRYFNQETILAGEEMELESYPLFNSPQEWGRDMVKEGFNLVSTANNHCLDRWGEGIDASMNFWDSQKGVVAKGTNRSWDEYNEIPVNEINGISYAFVSWTYGMNGLLPPEGEEYRVNCYDGAEDVMLEQVRKAKTMADVVIVAIHWGIEYQFDPSDEQKRLAQELADAGADIIIGNHPHVIEPIEWLNDHKTICFYALGNLISDQYDYSEISMNGMMAALTIQKTTKGEESSIEIKDVKADLIYTYMDLATHTNFEVIPYSQLDESLYPNYQATYDELVPVITDLDKSIQVGGF